MPRLRSARATAVEIAMHLLRCRVRFWHFTPLDDFAATDAELRNFQIVDGDFGLIARGDHKIALFCSLQFQVPC
jgi:hypothetical protein